MEYVGARVRRVEDPNLVQGAGRFVGNLSLPGMLHAGFVRSPHAHARIVAIDLSDARAMPGVVGAFSSHDLPEVAKPTHVRPLPEGLKGHGWQLLCRDEVMYVGDPVAVVVAEDPYILADALDAVVVEYEPLPSVIDVEEAATSDTLVWEDVPGNVAATFETGFGDMDAAFKHADVVIEGRFTFARAACAAMEPRAILAAPNHDGTVLTIWDSTQVSHMVRDTMAGYFGLDPARVRVIAEDVGGGFGPKGRIYPEEFVVVALALRLQRPVRWVATRSEDFLTTGQGRGQVHEVRLAARADGTLLGLDDRILQDVGAYTPSGVIVPFNTVRHLIGPYRLPALHASVTALYTNKAISSTLRGGGRPMGVFVMERMLDRLAARLGIDRAEIRQRNFVPPEDFPYNTGHPMGVVYDSGNFPAYMHKALEEIGYASFRTRQEEARREGRYLGLGLVAFIESTGTGSEGAGVRVAEDGTVHVSLGSPGQGQGHATAFAQMAAQRLGVPFETVRVVSGDTARYPTGFGTFASRMGTYGGNAVSMASTAVRERALHLAADLLEIAPEDLELREGQIEVRGTPGRGVALAEVAAEAARRAETLEESRTFEPEQQSSWAGGVNAAIVAVDPETGQIEIERYLIVHDAGVLVNPTLVEGQIYGGVVHGIGNAMYDAIVYNEDGQLLTSTFAEYDLPGPSEAPFMEVTHFETPSPFNAEGIKGAGEGGTIAAIPCIVAAVEDALQPFGVEVSDVPVRRESVWQR